MRFKDFETEPNYSARCRSDVISVSYEATEDLPRPPADSSEPKTSEFAYFKRLKQNFGHTSCRNPLNRESIPVRNFGPSNHGREFGKSKAKDVKSSQCVKKPTTGSIDSFLSPRNVALESSAMPRKESDYGRFNCSSLIKTPPSINLDSLLSATTNGSMNLESQEKDEDIFSSKRLKLRLRIAKTLFPETDEVPIELSA